MIALNHRIPPVQVLLPDVLIGGFIADAYLPSVVHA